MGSDVPTKVLPMIKKRKKKTPPNESDGSQGPQRKYYAPKKRHFEKEKLFPTMERGGGTWWQGKKRGYANEGDA